MKKQTMLRVILVALTSILIVGAVACAHSPQAFGWRPDDSPENEEAALNVSEELAARTNSNLVSAHSQISKADAIIIERKGALNVKQAEQCRAHLKVALQHYDAALRGITAVPKQAPVH